MISLLGKVLQWILDQQKVYYFAYGSNMLRSRIEERIGKVRFIGVDSITEWKLSFSSGYSSSTLNIEYSKPDYVQGVVYEITLGQLKKLDYFEGCPLLYQRFLDESALGNRVWIYIDPNKRNTSRPLTSYVDLIQEGIKENFPEKSKIQHLTSSKLNFDL